jgi:hypothetical protein
MHRADYETTSITTVINQYAKTWILLLQYDEDSLARPKALHPTRKALDYRMATKAIAILKSEVTKRGEGGDLFGLEQDHQLDGTLAISAKPSTARSFIQVPRKKLPASSTLLSRIILFPTVINGLALFCFCCFWRRTGCWRNRGSTTMGL